MADAIGWIGLGKMGLPMSGRLVAAGHAVTAYDVDADARAAGRAQGCATAASIAQAAAGAGVVISMVPDDAALRGVALGEAGVLAHLAPGAVYIDMSTVSPDACAAVRAAVRAAAEAAGAAYLAAPVSGSTQTARAGALTIMVSGPEAAYARAAPILGAMGQTVVHVGDGAQARFMKLAVNHLVGSTAQVVAEALTLGRKGGIAWDVLLDVLGRSVVASPLIGYKLAPLRARDFSPAFTVAQMQKDMRLVAEAMAAAGIAAPLADEVARLFAAQAGAGLASRDFFSAIVDVERRSGLGEP